MTTASDQQPRLTHVRTNVQRGSITRNGLILKFMLAQVRAGQFGWRTEQYNAKQIAENAAKLTIEYLGATK